MSGIPDANSAAQLAYLYRSLDENERLTRDAQAELERAKARVSELERVRLDRQDQIDGLMQKMDVHAPANAGYEGRLRLLIRMLATHERPPNPIE